MSNEEKVIDLVDLITKDEKKIDSIEKCLQEVVLICMTCGTQKPTGQYTTPVSYDSRYAYSHGYCSIKCAKKAYGDSIVALFSEYDIDELDNKE